MSEWQPIETAPKDGAEVLCFVRYERGTEQFVGSFDGRVWQVRNYCCADWPSSGAEPTHWQPLPEPPADA